MSKTRGDWEPLSLTDKQLCQLEKAGNCILGHKARDEIESSISNYLAKKSSDKKAPTIASVEKDMARLSKKLDAIIAYFSAEVGTSERAVWERIRHRQYWSKSAISGFDMLKFGELLSRLKIGCDEAKADLKQDRNSKKGGAIVDEARNDFLMRIDDIYNRRTTGPKRSRERFIICVTNFMPDDSRPVLPRGIGAINRLINRIKANGT